MHVKQEVLGANRPSRFLAFLRNQRSVISQVARLASAPTAWKKLPGLTTRRHHPRNRPALPAWRKRAPTPPFLPHPERRLIYSQITVNEHQHANLSTKSRRADLIRADGLVEPLSLALLRAASAAAADREPAPLSGVAHDPLRVSDMTREEPCTSLKVATPGVSDQTGSVTAAALPLIFIGDAQLDHEAPAPDIDPRWHLVGRVVEVAERDAE